MDLGIAGKWALVCAASKGLGKGCAQALVGEGVNVVVTARGEDALQATAARLAAESRGTPLVFPAEVALDRSIVKNETQTFVARRRAVEESTGTLRRSASRSGVAPDADADEPRATRVTPPKAIRSPTAMTGQTS